MYFTRHIRPAVIETLRLYTLVHKCAMSIHMQASGADKHTTRRRAPKELLASLHHYITLNFGVALKRAGL